MSNKQKKFQRILTFVLAAILALGFLSTVAFTVGATDGEVDFDDLINASAPKGECGENVRWVLKNGVLTISGTGPMDDFADMKKSWEDVHDQIKTVVITSGVTTIGDAAFVACYSLESVILPDTLTTIGRDAFAWSSLPYITIPAGVTTIEDGAFYACQELTGFAVDSQNTAFSCDEQGVLFNKDKTQLVQAPGKLAGAYSVPAGVKNIGYGAFVWSGITAVSIPSSTVAIGDHAFQNCGFLNTVTMADGVKTIGKNAFYSCNAMEKLKLANTVTTIGNSAFFGCEKLPAITIPASVTKIDASAFEYCTALSKVLYFGTQAQWDAISIGEGNECLINATRTYAKAAKITAQPKSVKVAPGQTAKVTVKATGDGLKYQWYYAKKGATSWTKSSVTTATFTSGKMSATLDGCRVRCVVTDAYGTKVTSSTAVLYMGNPAKITAQPKSVKVANGQTAKVTVKATGDGLTYTWYHKNASSTKYSKASVTGATYSVKMSSTVNGRYVYCVVKDQYGQTVQTSVVRVYMGKSAAITTQPKSVKVLSGKTAKLTIKATGDGLTYQWYYARKGATKWTKASANTNIFSLKMATKWNGCRVYCVVTDQYGKTVKSSVVTISLGTAAKITTQPVNVAVKKGQTAKVTIKATGDGLKYQWYYAKKGSSTFKKLSAKTATYSVKMSSSVNGRRVYCVVTDQYGTSVKSDVVTLYQGNPAKITTQPKSVSVAKNKTAKVTVKATGDGLKYTWYYQLKGTTKWIKASITKNVFTQKMAAKWNGCKVYCVVKDKYGTTVNSSVATLKMK